MVHIEIGDDEVVVTGRLRSLPPARPDGALFVASGRQSVSGQRFTSAPFPARDLGRVFNWDMCNVALGNLEAVAPDGTRWTVLDEKETRTLKCVWLEDMVTDDDVVLSVVLLDIAAQIVCERDGSEYHKLMKAATDLRQLLGMSLVDHLKIIEKARQSVHERRGR